MGLAERSLPKINPENIGGGDNSGGLSFCPLEEGVERAQPRFGGKTLFVSDISTMKCFAPFARGLRAISVFYDGDALPLFTMPDGVGSVFAAGGEETLKAARFFAEVRRVPCVLFPTQADLRGVLGREGEIVLFGEKRCVALAEGEVCVDLSLVKPTLAEGFASLLLARLALIEEHALRVFTCAEKPALYEQVFALTQPYSALDGSETVLRNYALRYLEEQGAPAGEGETLVRLHKAAGESYPVWRSYLELAALYGAFFECGRPRRHFVPDYCARAERAGTKYCDAEVPSPNEYAWRTEILEHMRGSFFTELQALEARKREFGDLFRTLTGKEPPALNLETLRVLPEHAPHGLSSYIRDFGLMEF
ncbi:MAG: hypothetical protein K2G44_07340 [Clostridia bacterium]|nr:hypothetical protein [Clostridia bacterium]